MSIHTPQYAGFWLRFLATLIDTVLFLAIVLPIYLYIYGKAYLISISFIQGPVDLFLNYFFPIIATLVFWRYGSATPGKMALSLIIVDAKIFAEPSMRQFIIRYFAYLISILPLCLGFIWIAFDSRKQGWHDKIANTVVIKK